MQIIYKPKGKAKEYGDLAVNLYNGCTHGCRYCYAPSVLRSDRETYHDSATEKKDALARLTKDSRSLAAKNPNATIFLSFTTDPYQPIEAEKQITREAIKIIKGFGLNVMILTKAGKLAERDLDLLDGSDWFGVTLTLTLEEDRKVWEPHAASTQERIDALRKARDKGIRTWVSIEPVIDPHQSLELIRSTIGIVDLYKIGKWNHDARANAIDWVSFRKEATAILEKAGTEFHIKEDLQKAV